MLNELIVHLYIILFIFKYKVVFSRISLLREYFLQESLQKRYFRKKLLPPCIIKPLHTNVVFLEVKNLG